MKKTVFGTGSKPWTDDWNKVELLIGWLSSIAVARAAVTATIAEFPSKKVTLRQGARVIDGSEKRKREKQTTPDR
jgi:hypothetical protein